MDKKDEKILIELLKNSRLPLKQIGKKVNLSREVVTYRINKLTKDKIITNFYPIIDLEKLGYSRNGCLIKLKGINSNKEKEFFSFLVNHPFITYIGVIVGKWNVAFDIFSKNKEQLRKIIEEIITEINPRIEEYVITNNSGDQEIYPSKIIGVKEKNSPDKKSFSIKLDKTDYKILKLLSKNSRLDYVELSTKTKLTANAVKYRIKNMEKSGIIKGYTISIDSTKLGYELYNLQIKLDISQNNEKLKPVLRSHPKVFYFYNYLGQKWDMDIGVIAKNSKDLRETLIEFRNSLGDLVKIEDIYTNTEILKGDIAPQGVFNN